MSISEAPPWMPGQHGGLGALDLPRALQAGLELRARRDHDPVVVGHDDVAGLHAHAAEQDRPADTRSDVAARPAIGTVPRAHSGSWDGRPVRSRT